MRKTLLLPLILAAACGPKNPTPVPAPPPTGGGDNVATEPAKPQPPAPTNTDDALIAEAKAFVASTDQELRKLMVDASVTEWANETDITPEHEDAAAKSAAELAKGITRLIKAARKFEPVMDKLDPATKRQLTLLKFAGQPAPDDPKQAEELAKIGAEMTSIYGKGKACVKKPGTPKKGQPAEDCRDIDAASKVLQKSRKPAELLAIWQSWHDSVGRAEREPFVKFVPIANAGARGVGFKDVASMWKSGYDMPEDAFEAETDRLWNQMKPLYDQLHCYTRRKLNKMYGDKVQPKSGPIMAHLTGNMWAQSWDWLYKELEPYPGQAPIDVTPTLEKSYDEKKMVKVAEAFYTSLGMPPLPDTFWERSMFKKPEGKEAVCHASAWDVTYSNDLRIKMCIQKTQEELKTIHHELGHDYYFTAYYKLPILFQAGANDGFHEAIGDTIALSMTPAYLKEKGLLTKVVKNDKLTINQQMHTALEKVAFLPFGLVIDKWRWDVFAGKVTPEQYNDHWWKLRQQYQGIAPPVTRAATDFDPGAKYHVPANVPYTRYFLAAVLQFQFHRALCKKAGFTGPLHECSIYNNKAAGEGLWKLLQTGASKPWQDTLFELTGQREMDATALLEYFAPLKTWLEQQNKGQQCGW
ncbi:MAG TPA: M2 family metallopeptidase [Kofleriaceae bacterium]|nr:M2 family metallopeptidase [Kofleriaceae bacterium]